MKGMKDAHFLQASVADWIARLPRTHESRVLAPLWRGRKLLFFIASWNRVGHRLKISAQRGGLMDFVATLYAGIPSFSPIEKEQNFGRFPLFRNCSHQNSIKFVNFLYSCSYLMSYTGSWTLIWGFSVYLQTSHLIFVSVLNVRHMNKDYERNEKCSQISGDLGGGMNSLAHTNRGF